jgi:hypothetical protein
MNNNPIRYFYDAEFVDNGRTIDLVSIGFVAVPDWALQPEPDGTNVARQYARTYYAVNSDFDIDALKGNDWLVRNVLPHLPVNDRDHLDQYVAHPADLLPRPDITYVTVSRAATEVKPAWVIANEVRDFILAPHADADDGETVEIELWADYGAYDHVVLAQLWGAMNDLPAGIPMYTNDLQQYRRTVGDLDYRPDRDPDDEHNALADAWYDLDLWAGLRDIERNNA